MARSIWKGSIAFGLVHIPVDLLAAEDPHELSFVQLDKRDFGRVGYERVNKESGKKVEWEDVVRGYEVEKDEYVVLSDEELEEANPAATHTIDIAAFVDAAEIHPMFFEKPYWLVPGKGGDKAYALLRATLERAGKAGIAKVVIRTRQHVAALTTSGGALMLVILRYAHELRKAPADQLPSENMRALGISDREIALAEKLVDGMLEPWKPEHFKDEYHDDVMALIHRKVKAGEVNVLPEQKAKKRAFAFAKVVDLMSALQASLSERGAPAKPHARPGPKKARHRPAPARARSASKPTRRRRSEARKSA
jgi:DNA end-binding protein Ku